MRKINLLPWREQLRREQQRNFMLLLALVAVLAAGVVFGAKQYFDARISAQEARNNYLRQEIAKLDRQIVRIRDLDETRQRLLDRKRVVEELQANRTLMVRLFDQLIRTVPSGIRLTKVSQSGSTITIEGVSQSQARISNYMQNIDASPVLHDPKLQIIEAIDKPEDPQMPFRFKLSATVAAPETLDEASDEQEQQP